jgi:hypothetical protein
MDSTVTLAIYLRGKHMAILDTHNGKKILLFLALFAFACDSMLYLSLNTSNGRLIKERFNAHEVLKFESDSLQMRLEAGLLTGSFKKERRSEVLGIDISIYSNYDIQFDGSKSYLVDSLGQKLFPQADSHFRRDSYYVKDKKHDIGIVFHTLYPAHPHIGLPATLHLSPLIFVTSNDTLKFGEIEIR